MDDGGESACTPDKGCSYRSWRAKSQLGRRVSRYTGSSMSHRSGMIRRLAEASEPGTAARLGRGVIIDASSGAPSQWTDASRVTIDDGALRDSAEALDALHRCWSERVPLVVELCCDVDELRAPETNLAPPYRLSPRFEFGRERLYFLARANNYDNRSGRMVWGPAVEASRLGATPSDVADVVLPDGTHAWCDGGPRAGTIELPDACALVHRNTLEQGLLAPDRLAGTHGDLAADQRDAVLHDAGAARVIAP